MDDKIAGMDLGADDYLTKPFAMRELLARIRIVSRRGSGNGADQRLWTGDLVLDLQSYVLTCAGGKRSVRLGAKEYQMMEYLMRNAGQVLSREQITQRVWGYEAEAEYNNVDVYMYWSSLWAQISGWSILRSRPRGWGDCLYGKTRTLSSDWGRECRQFQF